jgi:hypothetical protein
MGKGWQQLTAFLLAIGVPAAVMTRWWHAAVRHPLEAVGIGVAWWVACGTWSLLKIALAEPARARLTKAGTAADRAASWWLSGYGARYRQWVLDSRRYVSIDDLSIRPGDHTPQLDDIYVDVALVGRAPDKVSGNPLRGVPEDAGSRHQLSEFLAAREQMVVTVLGPPGSGKSTLLAYTAQSTARARRRDQRRFPVLLALREHAQTIVGNPATTLPELIVGTVSGVGRAEPEGWWKRQLDAGRCVVLLDGLDEVSHEEQRNTVAKWVEQQVTTYRTNHFVITSRPHGYRDVVISQAMVTAICPFTPAQVDQFLRSWYAAAERRSTGARTRAELRSAQMRANDSVVKLTRLLRARPALRDLAVNPLLLTMIAIVYREKADLPSSRADLYREICQVMLSRRIRSKGMQEQLPWETRRKILASLAYRMMDSHIIELSADEAAEAILPLLSLLPDHVNVSPNEFLTDIIRNGLLLEVAPGHEEGLGRIAFPHLTFQEYLAAQHAVTNPEAGKALDRAVTDPWWRETIILYAAVAEASDLVRACLDDGNLPAVALAFDCAAASSAIDPEARQRLADTRHRAYEPGCPASQRRLIAGIEALNLASHSAVTISGARVCDQPVSADLYWLFLQDTGAPPPDVPCKPGSAEPATGVRGGEARTFVAWLNELTAEAGLARFRLPSPEELTEQAPDSVTSAWIYSRGNIELWVRHGVPHPHEISAEALRQVISEDPAVARIMAQAAHAHAIASATAIMWICSRSYVKDAAPILRPILPRELVPDHVDAFALDRALALTLALTDAIICDRADALAFDRILSRALDRIRVRVHDDDLADHHLDRFRASQLASDVVGVLDGYLGRVRKLGPACELNGYRDLARELARDLDHYLDLDRYLVGDRALASDLARDLSHKLSQDLAFYLAHDLAPIAGHAFDGIMHHLRNGGGGSNLDNTSEGPDIMPIELGGIPGFPLRWAAYGPLLDIVSSTASSLPLTPAEFISRLSTAAGADPGIPMQARLDGSLTESLADYARHALPVEDDSSDWFKVLSCLACAYPEVEIHPLGTAGIAVIALALAADENGKGLPDEKIVLLELAATVALTMQRTNGIRKPTESIVLTLA